MNKKEVDRKYPQDDEITSKSALVELAKDTREIRNHFRSIPKTEKVGREKVAAWVTGYSMDELLDIMRGFAKKHGIETKRERRIKAKESRNILGQDVKEKAKQLGMPYPEIDKPHRFVRSLINNCVRPEVGKHVFDSIFKEKQERLLESSSS